MQVLERREETHDSAEPNDAHEFEVGLGDLGAEGGEHDVHDGDDDDDCVDAVEDGEVFLEVVDMRKDVEEHLPEEAEADDDVDAKQRLHGVNQGHGLSFWI